MVIAVMIPRFSLWVAVRAAGRPAGGPIALGPQPGAAQVVGACTTAAAAQGVRPGLRVGEALARCPALELVAPNPGAVASAGERILERLEDLGAAVEPVAAGVACFESRGLIRLHGDHERLLRRAAAALPVGGDGRAGAAPSRFAALNAAMAAEPRHPLVVGPSELGRFLAPLPIDRLADSFAGGDGVPGEGGPLDARTVAGLRDLGIHTLGQLAALPRPAVMARLGSAGVSAWQLARGGSDRRLLPRRPPEPLHAAMRFPEPIGALEPLRQATRMLIDEVAERAARRGRAIRGLTLRAHLAGGGSWARTLTVREATADPDRLALAALGHLEQIAAPVEAIAVCADASGSWAGHQLTVDACGADERRRRAGEAIRQVRSAMGDDVLLRAVEVSPDSRLPERRWALVPFET